MKRKFNLFEATEGTLHSIGRWLQQNHNTHVEVVCSISDSLNNLSYAVDIAGKIRSHGNVTVHYMGVNKNCSAVIGAGAKNRTISENSVLQLPPALAWSNKLDELAEGNLEDFLNSLKDDPQGEKLGATAMLATMFAGQTGWSVHKMLSHMKAGQMLTAQDAKALNLVCDVMAPGSPGSRTQQTNDGVDWETLNSLPHMREFL